MRLCIVNVRVLSEAVMHGTNIQHFSHFHRSLFIQFNLIKCQTFSTLSFCVFSKSRTNLHIKARKNLMLANLKKISLNIKFFIFKWIKDYLMLAETSRSPSLQAKSSRLISQSSLINFNQLMLPVGEVCLEGSLAGRLSETWWTACDVQLAGKQKPICSSSRPSNRDKKKHVSHSQICYH